MMVKTDTDIFHVAPGVQGLKNVFVNVYTLMEENGSNWVLVDAGLYGSANKIRHFTEEVHGPGARPTAIIMTHGHFDHVGSLQELAEAWDVPVYVHPLEMPYFTGKSSYPPPDPSVGGGMLSWMSCLYPKKPLDISHRVRPFPEDGKIPGFKTWRVLHTPGHAPGHVSFYRQTDKVLIAGDAFVTVKQESLFAVIRQKAEVHGPPMYFTPDWDYAKKSVQMLAMLEPNIVATGHGKPMEGAEVRAQLNQLAWRFDELAKPERGRYINDPAEMDEEGVKYVPPGPDYGASHVLAVAGFALLVGFLTYKIVQRKKEPEIRFGY